MSVEPIVLYAFDPNSFYNPDSAVRGKDGYYVAVNVVLPLGEILGL
jgi:hypothetical protein